MQVLLQQPDRKYLVVQKPLQGHLAGEAWGKENVLKKAFKT